MTTIAMKHEFDCDQTTFWQIFVDPEYNQALYLKTLGFPKFQVLEEKDTETEYTRTAEGTPNMNMPGPVQKLLGANFGYSEKGRLDKAKNEWRFKITPSTLADKMRYEGIVKLEKVGEGRVRRVVDITIEAKVFGIGGMLESTAEKSMRDGWEKSAILIADWIRKKQG